MPKSHPPVNTAVRFDNLPLITDSFATCHADTFTTCGRRLMLMMSCIRITNAKVRATDLLWSAKMTGDGFSELETPRLLSVHCSNENFPSLAGE